MLSDLPLKRSSHMLSRSRGFVRHVAAATQRSVQTAATAGPVKLPVIIPTKGVPIMLYTNPAEVEPQAMSQLVSLAEGPVPVGFVAAMPDVHLGKGATVGSVFASDKYVAPSGVGVDIGCGMCAVPINKLTKSDLSLEQMTKIQELIKRRVPTGFNEHKSPLPGASEALDAISGRKPPSRWLIEQMARSGKAVKQLGTLGGGNHFLEVLYDDEENVWVMLHSGSRNIGNTTAQKYDEMAVQQMRSKGMKNIRKENLAFLEINSKEGQAYLQDMEWCQEYAAQNRMFMLNLLVDSVNQVTGADPDMARAVNIHHNYCSCERCRYTDPATGQEVERDLWVTRKGATSARKGQLGIIPGSMGTGSFIVQGKGEAKSWSSCSHGAGRRMSRNKAFEAIPQADFERAMAGIVCDKDPAVRDEAPQAYKDLGQVMANQSDLVDVVHRLRPLINVKGFGDGPKRK